MKKRLFEILDEMNQADIEKGTRLVAISNSFIKSDLRKQGTEVLMGADAQASTDLFSGKVIPILILVDKEEYFKRNPK